MRHDPEQLAAAYLTGMRRRTRDWFEAHLLDCERCWQEVSLARRGRQLAEAARDLAPAGLREDIRAAVSAAAAAAPARHPPRRLVAASALALAATAVLARPSPHRPPGSAATASAVTAAAVVSYLDGRLPGTALPGEPAPVLAVLDLDLAGAARGELSGVQVTVFAYRTRSGDRLIIIRSSQPFPEAAGAREISGTDDAWTARSSGVTIICAQGRHTMLLLGSDARLVRQAGAILKAV